MAKKQNPLELPVYLFHQGTNYRAYEFLGAHRIKGSSKKGRLHCGNCGCGVFQKNGCG